MTLVIGLLMLIGIAPHARTECALPLVVKGHLNPNCIDATTALSGEWAFDYHAHDGSKAYQGLTTVPSLWADLNLPVWGYATYSLTFDETLNTRQLALRILQSWTATRISFRSPDGRVTQLLSSGHYDTTPKPEGVTAQEVVVVLPSIEKGSVLLIEMNAFASRQSGLWIAPTLGNYQQQLSDLLQQQSLSTIVAAILLVFALINLALWLQGDRQHSLLLLGLAASCVGIQQLVASGALYSIVPSLPLSTLITVAWASYLFGCCFGLAYIYNLHQRLLNHWLIIIPIIASVIGLGLLIFAPLTTLQHYGDIHRPIVIISACALLISLFKRFDPNEVGLKQTLIGTCLLIFGLAVDVFYYHLTYHSLPITTSSVMWLLFVGNQTSLVAQRYFYLLHKNVGLAKDLKALNTDLECIVTERTNELNKKNHDLEVLSNLDPLTGLPNRRALEKFADKEIARATRNQSFLALALLDLDFFKKINDQYGHNVGDKVLSQVSRTLEHNIRTVDIVSRWGGEEFCLIFPDSDRNSAIESAQRICSLINQTPIALASGDILTISASIGLTGADSGWNLDKLLHNADEALYIAKASGRNRVECTWPKALSASQSG